MAAPQQRDSGPADAASSQAVTSSPALRRWRPAWPVDLVTTLGVLARGRRDPTLRIAAGEVWRTTRASSGAATVHYARQGPDIVVRAWGPGAEEELEAVPEVVGRGDDPRGFAHDAHPVMAQAYRRFGEGWRVIRTTRVMESVVPAVLEQRVTGKESKASWSRLVREFGEPAPGSAGIEAIGEAGPMGMFVAPDSASWARIPSWAWHRAGVDPGRARTITQAAARGASIERLNTRPVAAAAAALQSLPGIGTWTAAEVAVRAWGDADAVSFGDYHLAGGVVFALTGRVDGTDEMMAELLAPWAGQRARAVRMLLLHSGHAKPRRGPRATIADHRKW